MKFALVFAICIFWGLTSESMAQSLVACSSTLQKSCYTGNLQLDPNPTDQNHKTKIVMQDIGFVNAAGIGWQSDAGDITDGATIPERLQVLTGEPFSPDFIAAAVIHDRYTNKERERRVRPWKDTHRMFYEALLAGNMGYARAKIFFYAVYTFGPRWSKQDPSHLCRGNLTPLCQNMRVDGVAAQSSFNDPMPAVMPTPEQLRRQYAIEPEADGEFTIYRKVQYDESGAANDLREVVPILSKLPAGDPNNAADIEADVQRIMSLSDQRHPAEGILLQCQDPNKCGDR